MHRLWPMPSDGDPSTIIAARCDKAVPALLERAADELKSLFGASALAVLGYGSCIRETDPTDGLVDCYVIVSDYAEAYRRCWLRWANRLLAPNVFYAAIPLPEATIRVKYAVIALDDFERGLTRAFLPYLWGRFAPPSRLLWTRDQATRQRLLTGFRVAVRRLLAVSAPLVGVRFTADELWRRALALSYATELRPESPDRAERIVNADSDYYRRVTAALVEAGELPWQADADGAYVRDKPGGGRRAAARVAWLARRWLGRAAAVLRLVKASMTFRGGVDYAAWKVERHTGASVPVTPRVRRYPLIFGWGVLWRLLRQRLLR